MVNHRFPSGKPEAPRRRFFRGKPLAINYAA
jgi:hypothetical protein